MTRPPPTFRANLSNFTGFLKAILNLKIEGICVQISVQLNINLKKFGLTHTFFFYKEYFVHPISNFPFYHSVQSKRQKQ